MPSSPAAKARSALAVRGIHAATEEQVTRVLALAALALGGSDPTPYATAVDQLLADQAAKET